MKRNLVIMLLLFISSMGWAQQKKVRFFDFETAIIEYTYEGNETGKQMAYIDEYGWRRAEWTNTVTKMFGQKTEKKEVMVYDGLDVWQWNPIARTGTHMRNAILESMLEDPQFDPQEYAKQTMESLGFVLKGKEEVQGKNCEVWEGMASTIWVWKGIGIKTEVKLLGQKTTWTATKIETNVKVPQEKFKVPTDITFSESQAADPMGIMMKALEEQNEEEGMNASEEAEEKETTEEEEVPMNLKELKNLLNRQGKR